MKYLRAELLSLLEEKIRDPCLNLLNHENGNKIIATIIKLISKDWEQYRNACKYIMDYM